MNIEIQDNDFERLQKLAVPLIDTPSSVITRILEFYETHHDDVIIESNLEVPYLDFQVPPLTHTKLLMAKFEGLKPDRLTWDSLLRLALRFASSKSTDFDDLKAISGANIVEGAKTDMGYKPFADLGFSYQGVSADDAMRIVMRITEYFSVNCEFQFEWRQKEAAFMPGKRMYCHISGNFVKVTDQSR